MKKRIWLILGCALLLLTVGCAAEPEHTGADAKTPYFETLAEMEEYADVVVKAVRLDSAEPVIKKAADGMVTATYTLSQVEITEICSDPGGTLAVGDVITVLENEAYDEEENIVYHVAGYNMMVPDASYLLFLRGDAMSDGTEYYVAAGINPGTVSLEEDGRDTSRMTKDGTEISDFAAFEQIWQEAWDKYCK